MSDTRISTTGNTGTDHGFKSDVQRLGQYVGQLHEDLVGIVKGAGEAAHSGVAVIKENGRNRFAAVKGKSDLATASIRKQVASHPAPALGIALGVGILVGIVGAAIIRSARDRS